MCPYMAGHFKIDLLNYNYLWTNHHTEDLKLFCLVQRYKHSREENKFGLKKSPAEKYAELVTY